MTSTMSPTPEPDDDPFAQVEQQIDWVEQLENLQVRHDSLAAARTAVGYVEALRDTVRRLAGRQTYEDLKLLYGADLANLVDGVRRINGDDWNSIIRPALLREN